MTHETVTEEYDIQAIICVVIKQKVLISVALKLSLHFTLHTSRVSCSVDYINQNLRNRHSFMGPTVLYPIISFLYHPFIPLFFHPSILSFLYPVIPLSFHP